jgi:hypothetical protein
VALFFLGDSGHGRRNWEFERAKIEVTPERIEAKLLFVKNKKRFMPQNVI